MVPRAYRRDVNTRVGIAMKLVVETLEWCIAAGLQRMVIVSTLSHERFYRILGFQPASEPFPHPLAFGVSTQVFVLDLTSERTMRRIHRLKR